MPVEVRLPQLGESIAHAKLSLWVKREGERVSRGDVIAEVETDKTSVEIESPGDGVLSKIHVPAGTDKVAVGALLAVLEAPRQEPSPRPESSHVVHIADVRPVERGVVADVDRGGRSQTDQPPSAVAHAHAVVLATADDRLPAPSAIDRGVRLQADHVRPAPTDVDADVSASPLARRMAPAAGLALSSISGSGAGGRIMKDDVEAAIASRRTPAPAPARASAPSPQGFTLPADDASRYTVESLSVMRRVSAERLTQSKQQIPHFYLRAECAMDEVARARDQLNAKVDEKLSYTAFTLRAVALALMKVPAANTMWADGAVRRYKAVDLAVAVNTPQGLIAPVVRGADTKSVAAINREIRQLAEKARAGTLKPDEYTGGTCTVSNLGMYGITSLYPIINPPQTCIVGVGAIEERPVVRNHALTIGQMMTATLAADHRALDGATGAEFLAAFKSLIEEPLLLLL